MAYGPCGSCLAVHVLLCAMLLLLRVLLKCKLLLGSAAYADRAHATPVMLQRQCLPNECGTQSVVARAGRSAAAVHPSLSWVTPAPIAHGI